MSFLERIILLPLVVIIAGGVFLLPVMPVYFFAQPSLESLFVVLVMVGLWPMCVAMSHGAFLIEHFIVRSISKEAAETFNLVGGGELMVYVNLTLRAGDYLSKALQQYRETLDAETLQRGNKLVTRHRAIARFVWPGLIITAIGGAGLVMIQVLQIPIGS